MVQLSPGESLISSLARLSISGMQNDQVEANERTLQHLQQMERMC